MSNQPNLPSFLQDLKKTSVQREYNQGVKTINTLNFNNHGTFYMVPFNGKDGQEAIVILRSVTELDKVVQGVNKQTGEPFQYNKKLRFFNDPADYGELDDMQMRRYESLKSKVKALSDSGFKGIRTKQYLLIQGYLAEHKNKEGKLLNEKQPAVLFISSGNVTKALNNAITSQTDKIGNPFWINELVNSELTGRRRFLYMSFSMELGGPVIGYQATVSIEKVDSDVYRLTGNKDEFDLTKHSEALQGMSSPVNKFLDIPDNAPLWYDSYIDELDGAVTAYLREVGRESNPTSDTGMKPLPSQEEEVDQPKPEPKKEAKSEKKEKKEEEETKVDEAGAADDLPF